MLFSIELLEARIAPAAGLAPVAGDVLPAPVTYVWDGSASNDWFTAANWTPDGVPDADDVAILNINSTIDLATNADVATFRQSAGIFTGPGVLTVLTNFDWSGGTMSGAGTTQVAAGATLSISGAATKTLSQRTLSNAGIATWGQGFLDFGNGATFTNKGSFVAQSDSVIRNVSGNNIFANEVEGTFANNTGGTRVDVAFSNAGILNIVSGTLTFNGNFTQTAGSTRVAGSLGTASILNFAGGDLTGSGMVLGNVSNTGATAQPGNDGPGVLTINGNYTQAAGGVLSVELGGIAPGPQHDQLNVSGTATMGGTLAVALINNFIPATGNVFAVALAGTLTGAFTTVTGEGVLTPAYTSTEARLVNNATTYVWDGSAGDGNWFTPANWTPPGVPGIADAAVLNINATITVASDTSVGSFQMTNGTLTTPPNVTFTVLESLTWTGGRMSGTGVTNANGGLLMNGAAITLDGRTFNLPAGQTATLSGPNAFLAMLNGARFNNAGTFLAKNDNDIRDNGGAASLFNNTGTFTRNTATGVFDIGVPLAQNGIANLLTGSLSLAGGGSAPATGDFNVSGRAILDFQSGFDLAASADVTGGGTVDFSSGVVTIGGSFTVPTVLISGGTANFNAPTGGLQSLTVSSGTANFNTTDTINLSTLTISGGTLAGTNTINSPGLVTWSGGTMSGTGTTNANGGLLITGFNTLSGRTINLPGGQTARLSTPNGVLSLADGARFNNAGIFLAQNDNDIRSGAGTGNLFTNSGTFTREAGSGGFEINVSLANSGTLNVATGTVSLGGGENAPTTGDFNVSSGATLDFQSAFSLGASVDVAGAGTVDFSFGVVGVGGTFAIPAVTVSGATTTFNVATTGLQTLGVSSGTINFNAPASGLQTLTAVTISGGITNLNTSDTLNLTTLTISGGTLNGTNTINASGLLTWTGGTLGGTGITNANGGLLISGFDILDGRTINLPGGQTATLNTPNGVLSLANGARFNNAGIFLAQNDNDIRSGGGTGNLFTNSGTFTREAGSGGFEINVSLANSGTLNVATGTVSLGGGENAPTTGDFNVSSGATLDFQSAFSLGASVDVAGAGTVDFSFGVVGVGGTFAIPAVTVSGATTTFNVATTGLQTLGVSSGTINFNAPASGLQTLTAVTISGGITNLNTSDTLNLTTLTISGGTLNGTNTINASGLLTWTGGTLGGTGITNANGGLLISGFDILDGRTINLPGGQTATLNTPNGVLSLANGARFNNAGIFLAQNDNDIRSGGGTGNLFTNSGTFTREAGSGGFEINVSLANSGTLNVATGTVSLGGGENAPTTGDFNVSSGATLDFQTPFSLGASVDVAGAGTVDFSSGIVTIGGTFAIPAVTVSGGTANFSVPTSGLQTLTISSGTANFNTTDTINLTTLTISGGTLTGTNTINSSGLINWTGGVITGAGVINANGGLLMNGASVTLDGRTFNLPAGQTATLSGLNGLLDLRNGARFNNAGTFLAQNDNDIREGAGTTSLFDNSGSFIRDTTAGVFDIRVPMRNTGVIDVQTGSLTLEDFLQSATASIVGGRSVTFTTGIVTAGGTINALVSNAGATLSPGENGAGELTINGNYTQSSGTFRVELAGVAAGQFDKLTINGTASLAGTLDLVLLSGFSAPTGQQFSVITYDAQAGQFSTITGAPGFTTEYQATGLVLTKAGVSYVWDAGAGVDNSWFNMLNWAPDGVPVAGDNAILGISATISLPTNATVQSFTQSAGILTGAGTLTANNFTWTGGTQAGLGATTIPVGGTFTLNGSGLKILTQRTLNQGGTGTWTDLGNVQLGNGALFANSGTFDIQTNATMQLTAGGTQPLVTNTGTIHKNAAGGTTTFNDLRIQNSGTFRVSVGTVALTGTAASYSQTGGSTTLSGGTLSAIPTLDLTGGTLTGVGTISGSVLNNGATVQPGGSLAAGTLSITGNYTQAGTGALAIDAGGTTPGIQHDQLNVGGTATLGGTLAVTYINGYTPGGTDVLNVVTAGTRTGTFSTVTGASPLAANYTPTQVQLILDNTPPPTLSINDLTIAEGASGTVMASFTATLSAASSQIVTVQYATMDGTATAPEDYTALTLSTLTFNPGEVSKPILVEVIGDAVIEPDETFFVNLSNPTNATLADAQAQGTIGNDDIDMVISPDGGSVTFTDVDGDEVVVKATKGEFTQENFVFGADGTLLLIDLTASGNPLAAVGFGKAKLTVAAKPRAGGNGMVRVGAINALGMGLASVKIDGNLGEIDVGAGVPGAMAVKSIKVDSLGEDGVSNAESMITGTIGVLKVKRDVKGALNVTGGFPDDGLTNAPGNVIGKVIIGGNLDGSAGGVKAGVLRISGGISSVVIKGGVLGGADQSGIFVGGSIGKVKISGDLSSGDAAHPVTIAALGTIGATKAKQAVALKTLSVGGDVSHAQILAGYRRDLTPVNPDASIGNIKVQGNWSASSVVAGVTDVTFDGFGRNDALIPGDTTPSLLSRIASITIAGSATGSSDSTTDFFGITAQAVGRVQAGSAQGNFNAGPDDVVIDPINNDFRAVDFA